METTITEKGQVVIPVKLRRKYELKAGTRFEVEDRDGRIVLRPITPAYVRRLRGILKGGRGMKVLRQEREKEKKL